MHHKFRPLILPVVILGVVAPIQADTMLVDGLETDLSALIDKKSGHHRFAAVKSGSDGTDSRIWDLGSYEAGKTYPSYLAAMNRNCRGRHRFEISIEGAPWMTITGPPVMEVRKGERRRTETLIDLRGVKPGIYDQALATVRCKTCPKTCPQDVEQFALLLVVDPFMSPPAAQDTRACGEGEWTVEVQTRYMTLNMHKKNLMNENPRGEIWRRAWGTWVDGQVQAYREPTAVGLTQEENKLQSVTQIDVRYTSDNKLITPKIALEAKANGKLRANTQPPMASLNTTVLAGGAGVAGVVRTQDDLEYKDGTSDATGTVVKPGWFSVSIGGILGVPLTLSIQQDDVDEEIGGSNANEIDARSAKVRMTSAVELKAEANNVEIASGGYSTATAQHTLAVDGNAVCLDDEKAIDRIQVSLDRWLANVTIIDSKGRRSFRLRAPKPAFGGVSKIFPGTPKEPKWTKEE